MTLTQKTTPTTQQAIIGPQGRLVIPAAVRKQFGWKEGTVVTLAVQDDGVMMSDQRAALRRLQRYMKSVIPEGVDILQDFLDDRRRAAELENREDQ